MFILHPCQVCQVEMVVTSPCTTCYQECNHSWKLIKYQEDWISRIECKNCGSQELLDCVPEGLNQLLSDLTLLTEEEGR